MGKTLIIIGFVIIVGCGPAHSPVTGASSADHAILNLSKTAEQLDSIHREKELLINVLEELETQQAVYSVLLDNPQLTADQARAFDSWRTELTSREKTLEARYALNVLIAHIEAARLAKNDPNQIPSIGSAFAPQLLTGPPAQGDR